MKPEQTDKKEEIHFFDTFENYKDRKDIILRLLSSKSKPFSDDEEEQITNDDGGDW